MGVGEGRPWPQTLAVTGGIGCGKSRVARWLAEAQAVPFCDADAEVRALLEPGGDGWQRLRVLLPREYFAADGSLLKGRLREAIFADDRLRRAVEGEIHPLVLSAFRARLAAVDGPCLFEVPLLYEVGWQGYFAQVLVVWAREAVCCQRLMARDGIGMDQALAAIRSQMPIMDKVALADYVVDNNGPWTEALRQLPPIVTGWPSPGEKKLDSRVP